MNLVQDSHSLNKVSKIWQFWACRPGQSVPFPGSTHNSGWATAGGPKEPSMLTGFLRVRPFKALPFLCSTLARERQKFYCPCLRLCTFDQHLSLSPLSTLVIPDIHIPLCFRKFRGFRAKASEIMQGLLFWVRFISPIAHFPDTASWQIAYFFCLAFTASRIEQCHISLSAHLLMDRTDSVSSLLGTTNLEAQISVWRIDFISAGCIMQKWCFWTTPI